MTQPTPRIRIWYSPGACSFAAIVLLKEAGLHFEPILAQVGKFSDEFTALNPKGRVPVLALDNEVITELPAVLTAIAQLVPERRFLGSTPLETVRVYEWLNWLSGWLHGIGFGELWRPERFTTDASQLDAIRAKGLQTVREGFAFIEGKLGARPAGQRYAVGSSLTAVDPFLLVFYRWSSRVKEVEVETDYPLYAAYSRALLERGSIKEAIKARL